MKHKKKSLPIALGAICNDLRFKTAVLAIDAISCSK